MQFGDCLNLSSNNTASTTGTPSGTTAAASNNLVNFAGPGAGSVNFSTSVNNTNTQIINGSGVTTGFASSAFVIGGATATSNV